MLSVSSQDQTFLAIRNAIGKGIMDFLAAFYHDWVGETTYSFLLEVPWEGTSIDAVAGTEEGLLRITRNYAASEGKQDEESFNRLKTQLRWGSPEDGWYENYSAGFFEKANQLISEVHQAGLLEEGDQRLQQLCLEVLRELDTTQVFGAGEERERIMIGVCDVGGDHAEEDFLSWAEAVNPPIVIERLRQELQESHAAFQADRELRLKLRET